MSALRRLTSSFRSERRSEQACPYSRPQPSPPKPKPTRRPRYWDFFNFFSFLAPYSDEEEEEAKKEAEAKAKASQRAEVIVVPEQDSEMSDASASTSSTEESTTTTSDSSLETVETADTSELAEPVEPVKPSEPVQPMRTVESVETVEPTRPVKSLKLAKSIETSVPSRPTGTVSSQTTISAVPSGPPSSPQTFAVDCGVPSSTEEPLVFTNDDDLMEWVKGKVERREGMSNADYLTVKMFFEKTRGDQEYVPMKFRFSSSIESQVPHPSPIRHSGPDATSNHTAVSGSTPPPGDADSSPVTPSYISGFHSSTGLPPFKNNIRPSRPRKVLKVDPNGSITLRGAGSVRSAPEGGRKRPAPLVTLRFDPYKRRRLFDEAKGPVTGSSGTTSQSDFASSASPPLQRFPRTNISGQHAVPYAPSPLRNVVNGSTPPSPPKPARTIPTNLNATGSRSTPVNQTASAAFLQEAVEKVTPRRPRYSDVVNPYQSAAPVRPVIKPMDRKRMSERRAMTREAEKQKEAVKMKGAEKRELSAKEIIEATVPKGAKRSRPPPGLGKSKPASKRVLEEPEESVPKKRRTVTVEEVFEDEDRNRRSFPVKPNVIIESRTPSPEPKPTATPSRLMTEVLPSKKVSSAKEAPLKTATVIQPTAKESSAKSSTKEPSVKVHGSKEQSLKTQSSPKVPSSKESSRVASRGSFAKGPSNHFSPLLNSKVTGKSSVPREPSKLRTSFLPDECENEEPKMASPTPSATVTMTTPGTPLADIQEKKDPKEVALTLPLNDLPSFIFKTPPALMAGDHTDARVAAKELPVTSLPKFDFSKARTAMNGLIFPAVPIPTIKAFDFESAGVKPKVPSGNCQWQCPTCMLQNSASAVEKCSICEAPRPGVQPKKSAVNGMNSMKKLPDVNGEIPSPQSNPASITSTPDKTVDFAAAALTPKTPVGTGQWTCATCMLQNPPIAVEKCNVCDSPRFGVEKAEKVDRPRKPYMNGTTHSVNKAANGISLPTAKSFDFAAAGLFPKAPSAGGNWHCPTCMLQNPATALEKCKVCDSPRSGMEKKIAPLPSVPVRSVPQLVPKSFDWAAAGMVPKFNGSSSWTCGTCMLSNPPTETEKCKVCDASRS